MGIPLEEMVVWDPDLEMGGLTAEQIRKAKLLLWKGHCSVHQMFQPAHIQKFREQHPDGLVIAHPECSFEVCKQSDHVGSTELIVKTIKEAAPNTRWLVGTELNLVNRLKARGQDLADDLALVEQLIASRAAEYGTPDAEHYRALALGKTNIQLGYMRLIRAVAAPAGLV